MAESKLAGAELLLLVVCQSLRTQSQKWLPRLARPVPGLPSWSGVCVAVVAGSERGSVLGVLCAVRVAAWVQGRRHSPVS